jgi:capsid protein
MVDIDPKLNMLGTDRAQMMAEGLHQQRNDNIVSSAIQDLENWTCGGDSGKVIFQSDDHDWNTAASHWFNNHFAYNCDYRNQKTTLFDFIRLALSSMVRDGDCLVVLDKNYFDGKIMVFEADQITNMNPSAWAEATKGAYAGCTQHDGVVIDKWGAVKAYIVTSKLYQTQVLAHDAEIIPEKSCTLVMKPYRFHQLRGESALLRIIEITDSLRNLIRNEVESAKRISEDAIYLHKADPLAGIGLTPETAAQFGAANLVAQGPQPEGLAGCVQVIGADDKITPVTLSRPSRNVWDFGEYFTTRVYKTLGMYTCVANGTVQYPQQAKAEIILTYIAIRVWQRLLEERMCNFVVEQAIEIGAASNEIPAPPKDWNKKYSVVWAKAPSAEFDQSLTDTLNKIKAGASTYEKEFGADWEYVVAQLAKEKDILLEYGLENVSFFETVAGKNSAMDAQSPDQSKQAEKDASAIVDWFKKVVNKIKGEPVQ